MARLDGSFKNAVIQGLDKPHCLVVHPLHGYVPPPPPNVGSGSVAVPRWAHVGARLAQHTCVVQGAGCALCVSERVGGVRGEMGCGAVLWGCARRSRLRSGACVHEERGANTCAPRVCAL